MKRSGLPTPCYVRRNSHLAEAYHGTPAEVSTRHSSSDVALSCNTEPPVFIRSDGQPGVLRLASALAHATALRETTASTRVIYITQRPPTVSDMGTARDKYARYYTRNALRENDATPEWIIHPDHEKKN